MKTPEEIKKALKCCSEPSNSHACTECPYNPCTVGPERNAQADALAYIQQLEEKIEFMKIQMQGDCASCKYTKVTGGKEPCASCMLDASRPAWEYGGLPELTKEGAPGE